MRHFIFALCTLSTLSFAGEPTPPPVVRLTVNGAVMKEDAKISARPGEKLAVKARVFGGRRAWCMEPARFANLGKDTKIETSGEQGLSFSTGPGFKGVWKLKSEVASWWGQLADDTMASPSSNAATITAPAKVGQYALQVKVTAVWSYDRRSDGNHVEEQEKNEAEATYTLVVEQPADTWFSSANITATGSADEDLRSRLKKTQERFELISQQVLDGKFERASKNLEGLPEALGTLGSRLDKLKKKQKPGFDCTITFIGTPMDKAMKRIAALEKMAEQWKQMHLIVSDNAQRINTLLLKPQLAFSNKILKSVVKNYLDWGSSIPGEGDFSGAVPVNLKAVLIPSDILEWYGTAAVDASILKNQALSIKRLGELQVFYQQRADGFAEESRKIHAALDQNKPVEALETRARGLLEASGVGGWKASPGR